MNLGGQVVVKILIVLALQAVFSAAKRPELIGIGGSAALLLLAFLRYPALKVEAAFFFTLGVLTPLLAWVGPQLLLGAALVFFLLRPASVNEKASSLLWAAPFGVYLLGGLLGELALALDLGGFFASSFLSTVQIDSAARIVDVWRSLFGAQTHSLAFFSRAALFICIVTCVSSERRHGERFLKGLILGSGVSAAFTIVQWLGLLPVTLPNQTAFWTMIHRVGGLMTDPNALGVVMGLSLWAWALLIVKKERALTRLDCLWLLLVGLAGIVAGSRTFIILVALLLGALVWGYRRRLFVMFAALGLLIVAVVTLLDSYSTVGRGVEQSVMLPEGIKRGVLALSLDRAKDTFSSRSLFLELARIVGSEHRLFGIGADRFREYVPLAGAQSGLVRGWTDNANNLYMGVLVELGIIGGLLVLLMIVTRTRNTEPRQRWFAGWLLFTLAVIMCTGPHIEFIEVLLVVACLIGRVTAALPLSSALLRVACLVAVVAGAAGSLRQEHGVYAWSESPDEVKRWLSNRAVVEVLCLDNPTTKVAEANLLLQARYIPTRGLLRVSVLERGHEQTEVLFTSQERQSVVIQCNKPGERRLFTIITRPAWSPYRAWPGQSGDRRLLGVEQITKRLAD
jgi:hypothetical protein